MLEIKYHASERFVERVMGLKDVKLNADQLNAVNIKILKTLEPYLKQIAALRGGEFSVDGHTYVVVDMKLLTVTNINGDEPFHKAVCGGRMRSGAKIKKIMKGQTYEK